MSDQGTIAAALDLVGPRLRGIRRNRGVTLTELAERTGISKSTLLRLENGQRRQSLEPLLPLAQAYRVPLDDLVGARRSPTRGSASSPARSTDGRWFRLSDSPTASRPGGS
jgi:transcriptional regulator with XRE-family HTH domain